MIRISNIVSHEKYHSQFETDSHMNCKREDKRVVLLFQPLPFNGQNQNERGALWLAGYLPALPPQAKGILLSWESQRFFNSFDRFNVRIRIKNLSLLGKIGMWQEVKRGSLGNLDMGGCLCLQGWSEVKWSAERIKKEKPIPR